MKVLNDEARLQRSDLSELRERAAELFARALPPARLLHPSAPRRQLAPDDLAAIADCLGAAVDATSGSLEHHGDRDYRRLLRGEQFEAWLIVWHSGSFLQLHDHGGSNGAFTVLSGKLIETYSDIVTRAPLLHAVLGHGQTRRFAAGHVHELWNPSPEAALSVHVYSPPLSSMNFFSHSPDNFLEFERNERDFVGPEV